MNDLEDGCAAGGLYRVDLVPGGRSELGALLRVGEGLASGQPEHGVGADLQGASRRHGEQRRQQELATTPTHEG
ncbi:MAG TPA: hypothetical protein VLA62_11085 [Solirubrobacterales bacterium]|nr:hypothetical protein [Solirubrobacterales bacterium]